MLRGSTSRTTGNAAHRRIQYARLSRDSGSFLLQRFTIIGKQSCLGAELKPNDEADTNRPCVMRISLH